MVVVGYAYVTNTGSMELRTVSDTEREAKVNALALYTPVVPLQVHDDGEINWLFRKHLQEAGKGDIQRVRVEVDNDTPA